MKIIRRSVWSGISLVLLFSFCSSGAFAITPEDGRSGFSSGTPPAPDMGYKKRFEVFKDMSGGTLYTEHNTYALTNVKVTYSETKAQDRPTGKARTHKVVGLIFFNGVLKEVVIYPDSSGSRGRN